MKPTIQLAETRTPAGKRLVLSQHDRDFSLVTDGLPLMTSREHESELELARLGCAHIAARRAPRVLIGGLGLGYTLRQTLGLLPPSASVVVAELLPDVVEWNRTHLAELTGHPLKDPRVTVKVCDVVECVSNVEEPFDAILIDIDNGPEAIADYRDHPLYSTEGIGRLMRALVAGGCLAIWSAGIDHRFERRLRREGLQVTAFQVPAYKGAKARSKCIWVASLPGVKPGNQVQMERGVRRNGQPLHLRFTLSPWSSLLALFVPATTKRGPPGNYNGAVFDHCQDWRNALCRVRSRE